MNSKVLSQIGLGNMDTGILLIIMAAVMLFLLVFMIVISVNNHKMKKRLNHFMQGKNAESLEKDIAELHEDNLFLKNMVEQNKKNIRANSRQLAKAIQKCALVKYDAYQQMGGMMSFALVLLDEDNNGMIFNSVHSAEGCYTYAKEIKSGQCKLELGNEEKIALDEAMGV